MKKIVTKKTSNPLITISNETTFIPKFDIKAFFNKILCLKKLKKGIYDINLVNQKTMITINKTHLERDYLTDIITFNLGSLSDPIGDIYISPDKAMENAAQFKSSVTDEIKLLLVHGLLHILEYRDYTEKEKKEMDQEQERLLKLLNESTL